MAKPDSSESQIEKTIQAIETAAQDIKADHKILKETKQGQALESWRLGQAEREHLKAQTQDLVQDMRVRLALSILLLSVVMIWLLWVAFIVTCVGMGQCFGIPFSIEKDVLIAILLTGTGTVVGLFHTVVKYFFAQRLPPKIIKND